MSVRGNQNSSALAWTRADSCAIGALLLAACVTRFWDLASPAVMFFDEDINVPWARCYLYGQPFANSHHPPLPILLIALSILIFGDRSWSWRAPSATLGASLVGVTYLLARRMFHSRLAGALASGLVLCSGLFLVNSRIALHEIFYLTFGAVSFWLLFEYADTERPKLRRRRLGWLGVTLGLGLASKLLIPALMELLVLSFLVFEIAQHHRSGIHDEGPALSSRREIVGALALVGGLSGLVYMAAYLPNYILGWWTGIGDQLAYYREMVNLDLNLSPTGHSYASRWWSWPLLLRPVLYYFHQGDVFIDANPSRAVIKALENPVIGWAVLAAIVI
ncbi:MAG TPA: glycosyltransferase family 39 protein, partial [Candidatus Binataceae bacterium]|nr:glycosyltransferase family 39 protein [Candidatus Binataceae bacterium]